MRPPSIPAKPFVGARNWDWSIVPGGYGLDSTQGITRLALDKDNKPYIFVSQGQISGFVRYAVKENGCWRFRFLDMDASYNLSDASMKIDSKHNLHLALVKRRQSSGYPGYDSDLSYIYHVEDYTGRNFTYNYPFNTNAVILTDKSDKPIVIFNTQDPNGRLLMTKRNPQTDAFETTEIDRTNGLGFVDIDAVIDSNGLIHIVAYDNDRKLPKYIVGNGSSWKKEFVTNKNLTGRFPKISLDSAGKPHVIFLATVQSGYREIYYGSRKEIGWNIEPVVKVNQTQAYFAFALDGENRPTILHSDTDNSVTSLTVKDKGIWTSEKLFEYGFGEGVVYPVDLAIGSDGVPQIISVYKENIASASVVYGVRKPKGK